MTTSKTETERLEIVREAAGQSVARLKERVDALLDRIATGEATDAEKRKAAVLARIILDRTGRPGDAPSRL
jgi:hypothetical protein